MIKQRKFTGGFTLIEVLVSVSIFSIVMLVSTGAVFSIVEANKKAHTLKSVMTNLNFALESMSRTIRVGTTYHCGTSGSINGTQDCPQGETYFAFEKSGGDWASSADQVVYCLGIADGGAPYCSASGTAILRSTDGGSAFIAITASEVVIEKLMFYAVGSAPGPDTVQPKVIMPVQGHADIPARTRTDFNLQTTIAQRLPDLRNGRSHKQDSPR